MNRGFAVFIILALISVILSFVIPDNSKRGFTNALSSYMIADEENKLNYTEHCPKRTKRLISMIMKRA